MMFLSWYFPATISPPRKTAVDEDEARDLVSTAIISGLRPLDLQLPKAQIEDLAAELLPLWMQQPSAAPGPGSLGALLPCRYVIPNQDINVVETCFSVLMTAANAGFFFPHVGGSVRELIVPITGIIGAMLKLVYSLRLAARLNPRDYAVIALLSKARTDGMPIAALLKALRPSYPDLSEQALERSLKAMTACVTVSGTKTSLVWKDEAGIWRTDGV